MYNLMHGLQSIFTKCYMCLEFVLLSFPSLHSILRAQSGACNLIASMSLSASGPPDWKEPSVLFLIPCALEFHIVCLWRDCQCSISWCPCPVSPTNPGEMTISFNACCSEVSRHLKKKKKSLSRSSVLALSASLVQYRPLLDVFLYLLSACCLLFC